jgi:hypothetical protein
LAVAEQTTPPAEVWEQVAAFIETRVAADEAWAWAASSPYEHTDEGAKPPPNGSHWMWGAGDDWAEVVPDPVQSEFVVGDPGDYSVVLRSVETWQSLSKVNGKTVRVWTMPRSYANSVVEMDSAAGGHIIRHDPAATLKRAAATRKVLARCRAVLEASSHHTTVESCDEDAAVLAQEILCDEASAWDSHPDYPEAARSTDIADDLPSTAPATPTRSTLATGPHVTGWRIPAVLSTDDWNYTDPQARP